VGVRLVMSPMLRRLVWSGTSIPAMRRACIVNRCMWLLLRGLAMQIWHAVGVRGGSLRLVAVSPVIVGMPILATSRLRYVWNDLHASRNDTGWSATSSGIRRGRNPPEAFRQLFHERLADIIGGDVNGIGDAKHDERPFR
jgi:hypothetical protein